MRKSVHLFHDHIRAAALMDEALRQFLAEKDGEIGSEFPGIKFNETDVWVLLAMTGWLDECLETIEVPKSGAELAAQLGFRTERTILRAQNLVGQGLALAIGPDVGGDRRRRSFLLTPLGRRLAKWLFLEVADLDANVRMRGGIERNARTLDVQRVVLGLCEGERGTATTKWLERRRLPSGKAK